MLELDDSDIQEEEDIENVEEESESKDSEPVSEIETKKVENLGEPIELFHEQADKKKRKKVLPDIIINFSETPIETKRKPFIFRNISHDMEIYGGLDYIETLENRFGKEKHLQKIEKAAKNMDTVIQSQPLFDIHKTFFKFDDQEPNLSEVKLSYQKTITDIYERKRPIVDIDWNPINLDMIAAAYCNPALLPREQLDTRFGFIWSIYRPLKPFMSLDAKSPLTAVAFSKVRRNVVAGGTQSGQVCIWDLRYGSTPIWITKRYYTFYDATSVLQWTNQVTGNELTAASIDGQIHWYDIRSGSNRPFDKMITDMTTGKSAKLEKAVGISAYNFDDIAVVQFLAGTTDGKVFFGSKTARSSKKKIGTKIFNCHEGPVTSIMRNGAQKKYFLTTGDWLLKIWRDDYYDEPMYWTNYDSSMITNAQWSLVRPSVVLIGRQDGNIELWDFLEKSGKPLIKAKTTDYPMRKATMNDKSELIATGDENGSIAVFTCSENFRYFNEANKADTVFWLEREQRREKLLEFKLREQRIRAKKAERPREVEEINPLEVEKKHIKDAIDHFHKVISDVEQKRKEYLGLCERSVED